MERVVTINLNGNAWQLDEAAYDALRAYLGAAEAGLKDNPDRAEILSDLEQAIADKCSVVLGPRKSVVSAGEMQAILKEMGPVTDSEGFAEGAAPKPPVDVEKRLYRLRQGAWFAGVCSGIGAFFKIDPTIVRVIFVIAALITQGAALLVYLVMMFVVPSAETSEEWAAAHGLPFNAQEIIDTAKKRFGEVAENQNRMWKSAQKPPREPKVNAFVSPVQKPAAGYGARMFAGVVASVCALAEAVIGLGVIFVVWSLFTTGAVLGVEAPDAWPLWGVIIGVVVASAFVTWPLRAARRAAFGALGYDAAGSEAAFSFFAFIFTVGGVWYAFQYWPAARDVIEPIWLWFRAIIAPGGF
ncbi:MAG: PspC domain-containing protein [Hyphomonadaceae bacterium]|nr:PspC domain-containing protein [Hyphomonadaceae bacterium]